MKGAKGSWRGAVLGALYGLVEANSAKVLLSVARVVLAVSYTMIDLLPFNFDRNVYKFISQLFMFIFHSTA